VTKLAKDRAEQLKLSTRFKDFTGDELALLLEPVRSTPVSSQFMPIEHYGAASERNSFSAELAYPFIINWRPTLLRNAVGVAYQVAQRSYDKHGQARSITAGLRPG
jgi:hypothetical protein